MQSGTNRLGSSKWFEGATPKPEVMEKRMDYDLWYVNNWTIWLDVYIIFKTFYALIRYKGD